MANGGSLHPRHGAAHDDSPNQQQVVASGGSNTMALVPYSSLCAEFDQVLGITIIKCDRSADSPCQDIPISVIFWFIELFDDVEEHPFRHFLTYGELSAV